MTLTWKPVIAAQSAAGHALWVLDGRTGQAAPQPSQDYARLLLRLGRPVNETRIGQHIVMWRFARLNDS